MSKSGKTELYKSFLEAFKNAHSTLPKATVFHKAQTAWNEMKHDHEKVKEKIQDWAAMAAKHNSKKLAMWAGFFKTSQKSSNDQPRNPSTGSTIGETGIGTEQDHPLPSDQIPPVEETSTEPSDSRPAESERKQPMEEPETEGSDQPRQQSTEASDSMEEISTEPSDSGPSERKRPINTPAQDKIKEELNCINSEILYILSIKKSCGLSTDLENKLKHCEKDKVQLEKKLKRKLTDAKAQAKARGKKVAKLEKLMSEAGEQIKHTPGRPRLEEKIEGLAEAIYNIVVPEGAADERRRTETINTIKTIDDLKRALEEKGYLLSRSALYYRLIPANVRSTDGKHHFSTVNVKLCRPQNNQRKPHIDGHFASATVKYVKELAGLFGRGNVFFVSQDDKARVPIGLPISKKQSLMLMHLDYKVTLPDHDFPIGEKFINLFLLFMPVVCQKKTEGLGTVDPLMLPFEVQSTIKVQLKATWLTFSRS